VLSSAHPLMALKTTCRLALFFVAAAFCARSPLAHADAAPFDLAGPKVDVRVERAGTTLPISAVPNLAPGDRIWLHPDFPESQNVHYLLIVAFLRGSTNEPPENWFTRAETWNKKVRDEGIFVVVPQEAEQALVFLAPETGGDFTTLRKFVSTRPGAFVRASQDLNLASLDRMRLEKYLEDVRETSMRDPEKLEERTKLLARSLNIKVDPTCFDKPANEQATCLTSKPDQMVLTDGHTQSMVATVTSGASADLMSQLSYSAAAGAGYFSPYVGAVIDIIRILDTLHTAEYQYIPALSLPKGDTLNLKLNNPPSFRNPKSVIVIALPPVDSAQIPPLRAVNPKQAYCVEKPDAVLNVEGAPLVFATDYAHDLKIHISSKDGKEAVLPVTADPELGGFVLDGKALKESTLDQEATGYIRGMWGFQPFDGPSFHLANAKPEPWHVSSADQSALITGRTDTLHLHADSSACVSNVSVLSEKGDKIEAAWAMNTPDDLEVKPALLDIPPGKMTIAISQFGLSTPDNLNLQAYSEAGHLNALTLYAGDQQAVLHGTRLDQVAGIDLNGVRFSPGTLRRADDQDELEIAPAATAATKPDFQPNQKLVAKVSLKDGRTLPLPVTVASPRPQVRLITKSVQPAVTTAQPQLQTAAISPNSQSLQIHLSAPEELPLNARLSFAVKTVSPEHFPRTQCLEVATEDESLQTTLSVANGKLVLEDATTVVATLDPQIDLGASAFGPLKFRPVEENGTAGDWQPLAQLVRLPVLTQLKCVKGAPDKACTLTGSSLFLIDSIAADPGFTNSITVPEGYADLTLSVPHPDATKTLYVKLRDDPAPVNTAQPQAAIDTPQQSSAAQAPAATATTPAVAINH
jgi:hypothetical protein